MYHPEERPHEPGHERQNETEHQAAERIRRDGIEIRKAEQSIEGIHQGTTRSSMIRASMMPAHSHTTSTSNTASVCR